MFNQVDKPIKFGIDQELCFEGEVFKTFDNVLKFFNKKKALKYVRDYYKKK